MAVLFRLWPSVSVRARSAAILRRAREACELGDRTLFTSAAGLIATLGKALGENRLDDKLKVPAQPQVLIIDEIGYIPIDRQGANLFFQLISRRCERGAIIITSNQSLGRGARSSGTPSSRPQSSTGCCTTRSRSTSRARATRLREKLKAGLLKPKLGADHGSDGDARREAVGTQHVGGDSNDLSGGDSGDAGHLRDKRASRPASNARAAVFLGVLGHASVSRSS